MIVVVISVDWEGRSLLPENLDRIAVFRQRHPDVPMQHFLNAAYFTRGINARQTTEAIRQALLPIDEQGLHIHAWHSLLTAAHVALRDSPRFLEEELLVPKAADDWGFYPAEDGYDVPLEHFEPSDLDRLIHTSSALLTANGFQRPVSFRAGGWMSGPKVQSALARNGFELDCSAVDPQLTIRRLGEIPLAGWLRELWPGINETSQPYRLSTSAGSLWQVPNNAGLVDYLATDALLDIFERLAARWRDTPKSHQFFSTGFHQETARKFLDRLEETIERIRHIAERDALPLIFSARPQELLGEARV